MARLLQIGKTTNAQPEPGLASNRLTAPLPGCLQVCPSQCVQLYCCYADLQRSQSACRYAVADSPEALYVAFVGTKQRRDYWTLAAIRQQPMWPEDSSEAVSRT